MKRTTLLLLILSSCLVLTAQTGISVKGVVLDALNGTPLPHVTLFFEGTSQGDLTNSGGEFTIDTSEDVVREKYLKIMFTGYQTQKIKLGVDSLYSLRIYLAPVSYSDEAPIMELIGVLGNKELNPLLYYLHKLTNIVLDDNLPLGNPKTNKFDLYRIQEIPTYNHLEGFRLKLSMATNARLHPYLFAKGYAGYGFKDGKWKYRGELAWSFDEKAYHDDEFPRNSIRLIHENDIFSPGGKHPRLPNNFLLYSHSRSRDAMTYRKFTEVNYEKETLYGLSYQLWGRVSEIRSASKLTYSAVDVGRYIEPMSSLKSKNAGLSFLYYPKEAYIQKKRNRALVSYTEPLFMLSHTVGENSSFGGNELYHKTELSFQKRLHAGNYGNIDLVADYQRIWTKAPFPLLLYPNANRGFFVDNKAFFLVRALDFINDEQYSIRATYIADNLLLSRVPFFKLLGFKELFILRGFHGNLSSKNIPTKDNGLFVLPQQTITMNSTPYIEGVVGATNILGILRVEYIRRFTYRSHPEVLKHGVRLEATF